MGTHDVRSIADAGDVLELLGPAVRTLRDTSPADPICIRWGRTDGELRFDVYSLVDGEQRALGLARVRGERAFVVSRTMPTWRSPTRGQAGSASRASPGTTT